MLEENRRLLFFLIVFALINILGYAAILTNNFQSFFKNKPVGKLGIGVMDYTGITPAEIAIQYKIPILMYHYVEYNPNKEDFLRDSINIEPSVFEKQIKTLKNAGYIFITPSEMVEIVSKNKPIDKKYVILSFDDGYRDFYTDVFPILKKHNIKAVVYIVYNFMNKQNYMYDSHVREIAGSGLVEIGSHTLNHRYLTKAKPEVVRDEIIRSKELLESKLETNVASFAYPYGAYNDELEDVVKEAGYTNAVTTELGNVVAGDRIYAIPRIRPGYNTGSHLVNYLEDL